MNHALCHAGNRIHKISSTLSKAIGDWGGGGEHSASAFYSVKLCVMINFSLCHDVLCFSFVVVCTPCIAYMQLLKWFFLMKEIFIVIFTLRGGGGDSYLKSDFYGGKVTKILNFALKIKEGREGGTCEVLRPCHPKIWNVHL